ncbi:MAG: hypothetical protein IPJ29_01675 [Chitinophagaceae bacterium]|nr:hypothetical protein [Chitinophagaceae bacterium]
MSFIKKRWVLPSLSITLEKSWNEDDLIKYQHNKPSYSDAQVIGLDDFVGFIGVKENIGNLRIRLSAPLTPFNYKGWSNFCIAPYYVYRQTFSSSSSQIFGFSLNYFSEGITGRRYNYTDAFGIGFDWERMAGKKVEPKFFIYGTLNIGKILKVKDDD